MNTITQLTQILKERKLAQPEDSYVASLYEAGLEQILSKVAEESSEVQEAAREAARDTADKNSQIRHPHLIHEVADLWFHTLVLLVHQGQDPHWVLEELEQRIGTSGHTEKAARSQKQDTK